MSEPTQETCRLEAADQQALDQLHAILKDLGSVAVALSGGVDSTLLARAARDAIHDKAIAVTAVSPLYPDYEIDFAKSFAKQIGLKHLILNGAAIEEPFIRDNPPDRCYHCKKAVFQAAAEAAKKEGIPHLVDATNLDDLDDYRPGMKATEELGVGHPLVEAGFDKARIRRVGCALAIPGWDRPSMACLASRFPYGATIDRECLDAVGRAEAVLRELGFIRFRVRHHGEVARIELGDHEVERLLDPVIRRQVHDRIRDAGFAYVAVDLMGYRTGAMNETLEK